MNEKKLIHFVDWKKIGDGAFESTLSELRSWGVTDIVAHPVWGLRERREKGFLKKTASLLETAGLRTPACHAFWGDLFDLGCADEERRREAMKEHCGFIRGLVPMGVKTYTLHLGLGDGPDHASAWDRIRRSVDELLPAAEETSVTLALENGSEPMEDIHKLAAFAKEYAHPRIGLCFDSGHANCYSSGGLLPVLERMRNDIATCHIHDNHGSFDDHNPPGDGNIDWGKLIPALKSCPRMLHAETESGDRSETSWKKFLRVWKS